MTYVHEGYLSVNETNITSLIKFGYNRREASEILGLSYYKVCGLAKKGLYKLELGYKPYGLKKKENEIIS